MADTIPSASAAEQAFERGDYLAAAHLAEQSLRAGDPATGSAAAAVLTKLRPDAVVFGTLLACTVGLLAVIWSYR